MVHFWRGERLLPCEQKKGQKLPECMLQKNSSSFKYDLK
ncbi:hypothetical protein COO91_00989 [Nostoc flagelliforme CCNUN1]|uniref:Uncharacterized protein n=1 Tax=Nostoc flagelliforme CCNUN1 TaxID=2038116 RepID=A0A2K8SIH8_9NOSO|nr:hypothetical protein COO91_00989 [Nostoc flagelliforme CCNUN1]